MRIRDLGVIADATIAFHPGLTVLTGETGAGKTMVVSGLGLLLGGRADAALVRTGSERLIVEGVVDLAQDHPAMARAREAGADVAEELLLARTVTAQARSRAYVGGRAAPVGVLSDLGKHLVAVHGQADQWRLRRKSQHRELLDDFAGPAVRELRAAYGAAWEELRLVTEEADRLERDAVARNREAEALRHGLGQIEQVAPEPGEQERLDEESERLAHAAQLTAAAEEAAVLLAGDDTTGAGSASASELLGAARHALDVVADHDPALQGLRARLIEVGHLLADVQADLSAYAFDIDADPVRLAAVQERQAALTDLTRRFGPTFDDVLDWRHTATRQLLDLDGGDDRIVELRARAEELRGSVERLGGELSAARRAAGEELGAAITGELAGLAMDQAVVRVAVTQRSTPGRSGADEVEILLQANPGSRPASIATAASGGELSRVMLAVELVTADSHAVPATFVFDEVDAGIGGQAALAVGARLARLAAHAQVIVVTHLAQVAAYADRHLVVSKSSDESVTEADVATVEGQAREAELARMMGGSDTGTARVHARELLAATEADALTTSHRR